MSSVFLDGVGIEFPLYTATGRSLKKQLMRATTGGRIVSDAGRIVVKALNGLQLSLGDGDRLGLIGSNGAGKTTLLRVLGGVYEPTSGTIRVEGRVTPLFDIGLGIDPEATGYENIFYRGTLLGIQKTQLRDLVEEIEEFTELGDYLAVPVRTYSAGMVLRLAFGVSTCVNPEVLLLDEIFGVGDAHFLHKAEKRLESLIERAGILVFASHSLDLIKRLCNQVMWMDGGNVRLVGRPEDVLEEYRRYAI